MLKILIVKLILFSLAMFCCRTWTASNILSNLTTLINKSQWRDQFVLKTTLNNQQFLIFYGGRSQTSVNASSNSLYRINLKTKQTKQLALNKVTKPTNHYSVCGTIVRDRLLIYGGYQSNNQISNELWQYDFQTDQWAFRGKSLTFKKCDIIVVTNVYSNDTATIIGTLNNDSNLRIIQYSIFSQTFKQNISNLIYNSISLNSKLWDGQSDQTLLRIQSYDDLLVSNNKNIIASSMVQFSVKYFCLLYLATNVYSIVTNNGMYILSRVGNNYQFRFWFSHNQQQFQSISCSSIGSWFFFIQSLPSKQNPGKENIYLQLILVSTMVNEYLHAKRKNTYINWIEDIQYFTSFIYQGSIFILNQKLQVYNLNKTCDNFMNSNPNVFNCVFGMYSCIDEYTGANCSIKTCKGSLRLYDANNLTLIDIQCSGNGVCEENGCKCNQNWAGPNCQIYQKKNCKGTLIQNFISSNCQCEQPTVGGNECDVVFCYNDCSGKGTCQKNGECICNVDYTGPDCSILKITFDLI